jgi:membrane-associated phospholipid phosphatase
MTRGYSSPRTPRGRRTVCRTLWPAEAGVGFPTSPISALTQATRQLFGNPGPYPSGSFPSEHPYLLSVLWTVAILLVFVQLGIRRYRAIDR